MFELLIIFPVAVAALSAIIPGYQARSWLLPVSAALHLLLSILLSFDYFTSTGSWIGLDDLSKLVLVTTSLLFLGCALYAVGYLDIRRDRGNKVMVPCLLIFLSAMTLAISARHLGLLWFAVEATTISSAPLIYFNCNRLSLEATWKYLLICSVGIAFAMLGIMFIAYSGLSGSHPGSLQLDTLLLSAPTLSKPWLHAGFVFALVGFGTKMGLAPLHTWKPDAYGEAPGLVGALLAGGLTSVAFLAILRGVQLMTAAGDGDMARHALLYLGTLSLFFAAAFMVRQPDIKRLLAYSSVEQMGLLAIGVGIGGIATFGAMLHLVNNALTKGGLFLTAGNIQRSFDSKNLTDIRGAIVALPVSGTLFLMGFLAITGSPPFGPFLSEFTIIRGIFGSGHMIYGLFILLFLAVVFMGMGATVLTATQGNPGEKPAQFFDRPLLYISPLCFMLLVLLIGVYLPEPFKAALHRAAALLEVQP